MDLAEELVAVGFVEVTPRLVESWRARGLLGGWGHAHRGGPGSIGVPAIGALQRARLTARLMEKDRVVATVTLLALATEAPVDVEDVRSAVTELYEPLLVALRSMKGAEPADRADALMSEAIRGRRSVETFRRQADKLSGTDDPQQPWSGDRTTEERTHDKFTAVLAAIAGDPHWITPVLLDAFRLVGMGELIDILELGDSAKAVGLGGQIEQTAALMIAGLAHLDTLTEDDIRAVQTIFAAHEDIAEFAMSTEPFLDPDGLVGIAAHTMLSQLAYPGQLRDGLPAAWGVLPGDDG